ncbi:BON domain-containing protein [Sphingomonas sanguinis]|uniref:Ornithine aminotransferase n=1 Tax=Sphingomonas sanguinis TaxID=33051 RepID=A0A147HTW4_9SPHN|nr:BON domain-containing protein [Sphingomonas sanguinis]KTT68293.1 ornithine aminotransferase [Sphingomonas sanguinis]
MSHDDQLQKAVLAELKWEPSITAAHIGVTAENGTVTLSGHVQSYAQKHAAEMATGRVKGVRAVAEELEVRLPFEFKRDDADIAAAAVDRLAWDTGTPRDAIKVKVEKGWLTLTGEVHWHFQREAAEREVRNLMGVIGVSNAITIKPRVDTAGLSDDIQHALHRSWFFDTENVHVTAQEGRVKLTGTVNSWQERQTAASTAWAAPGATSVENDLIVA